jgi:hypothetical protein
MAQDNANTIDFDDEQLPTVMVHRQSGSRQGPLLRSASSAYPSFQLSHFAVPLKCAGQTGYAGYV